MKQLKLILLLAVLLSFGFTGCSTMAQIAKHLSKDSSVVHVDVGRRLITRVGAAGLSTNQIVVTSDGNVSINGNPIK